MAVLSVQEVEKEKKIEMHEICLRYVERLVGTSIKNPVEYAATIWKYCWIIRGIVLACIHCCNHSIYHHQHHHHLYIIHATYLKFVQSLYTFFLFVINRQVSTLQKCTRARSLLLITSSHVMYKPYMNICIVASQPSETCLLIWFYSLCNEQHFPFELTLWLIADILCVPFGWSWMAAILSYFSFWIFPLWICNERNASINTLIINWSVNTELCMNDEHWTHIKSGKTHSKLLVCHPVHAIE